MARFRALARRVRARNRGCYGNAVLALVSDLALDGLGARYVDGWVVPHRGPVLPVEHAWLALPDGTVVDPTPLYCARGTSPRSYYAGLAWTRAECLALFGLPDARYTFRLTPPAGRWDDAGWIAAARAAYEAVSRPRARCPVPVARSPRWPVPDAGDEPFRAAFLAETD